MAGIIMKNETVAQVINFDGMKEMRPDDCKKIEQEKQQPFGEFLENM